MTFESAEIKPRLTRFLPVLILWAAFVGAVSLYGTVVSRESGFVLNPIHQKFLHGFVTEIRVAPLLARWDSIWYYGIANEGYNGPSLIGREKIAMHPLYPALMRGAAELIGDTTLWQGGLWVSRLCLLAAMILLFEYARTTESAGESSAMTSLLVLLSHPAAYIMISVYSESLFLALVLGAVLAFRNMSYKTASVCLFFCSLTRLQSLAFIAAFGVEAFRTVGGGRDLRRFMTPAAGLAGFATFLVMSWKISGSPFSYFAAKRAFVGKTNLPWEVLDEAPRRFEAVFSNLTSYTLDGAMQYIFATGVVGFAICLFRKRQIFEATLLSAIVGMSIAAGSMWAFVRFSLCAFPVVVWLPRVSPTKQLLTALLVVGFILQAAFLSAFMHFDYPAP